MSRYFMNIEEDSDEFQWVYIETKELDCGSHSLNDGSESFILPNESVIEITKEQYEKLSNMFGATEFIFEYFKLANEIFAKYVFTNKI